MTVCNHAEKKAGEDGQFTYYRCTRPGCLHIRKVPKLVIDVMKRSAK